MRSWPIISWQLKYVPQLAMACMATDCKEKHISHCGHLKKYQSLQGAEALEKGNEWKTWPSSKMLHKVANVLQTLLASHGSILGLGQCLVERQSAHEELGQGGSNF